MGRVEMFMLSAKMADEMAQLIEKKCLFCSVEG